MNHPGSLDCRSGDGSPRPGGARRVSKPVSSRSALALILVALGCALVTGACTRHGAAHGRALLIGIDGASMRVIEPMMKAGRLPHLAELARTGASGKLRSSKPIFSPRIWNTIATGVVPEKHGIEDFARTSENGTRRLYLGSDRKVHALWNIASAAGLSVGVVNWWNTYPLEPIRGVMVSDHVLASEIRSRRDLVGLKDDPPPAGQTVYPEEWQKRVTDMLRDPTPVSDFADPFAAAGELPRGAEERRANLSRRFEEDGAVTRIALAIEEEIEPELLMVFLSGIDRTSHFLWGTIEPGRLYPKRLRPNRDQRQSGATALRAYYEYTDALIGLLMARYGPEDLVMVVSDHGFEAGVGLQFLTGMHEGDASLDGVIFARGRDIGSGVHVIQVSVADITPTILAWFGLPIAEDMDGKRAGFLATPPTDTIASYETSPVERLSVTPSGAEEEMLDQLEALGYFERD